MPADPERLRSIKTFVELVKYLRDELEWPIESDQMDELTFDWSADDLRVSESKTRHLEAGIIRQLRPLVQNQPWGIFFVEFADDKVHRTALREILRGLVPKRRREPNLPAWQHEDLLFICTTMDCERFTFVHFRGEKAQKARLASFGWQRESPYLRTLCEFNLPKLRWPEDPGNADQWRSSWASAFDKEPLTKEFFRRFDDALERVKGDLENLQKMPSAEAYSRAQMLLERLLFLYFLKNRGWLNQQRDYLLDNFKSHSGQPEAFSYYADFLEKLFWSLATPPGGGGRLDGIAFLNGGLFDDDEFATGPVRQKAFPTLKIRNSTFAFLFSHLLEAFNFTVREDTPLNQDVAVDPEMLGKVFESIVLHAEAADPDAVAPDKRKATGSYYTPRIVVHFICREALRQYLLTRLPGADWVEKISTVFAVDATDGLDADELKTLRKLKPADGRQLLEILRDIKACDPAVGSGAFPVGLMHELVNLRRIADTIANGYVDPARQAGTDWIHQTKAEIVENCLYGVDIQQQAIEICRLRLWLSLIVDYDIGLDPFTADVKQFRQKIGDISQLPNLEMNFRRGDSLLDIISGVVVRVTPEGGDIYRKEYDKIHKLGLELHRAKKSERKRKLRVEILDERLGLTELVLTNELKQLEKEDSTLAADWFGGSGSDAEKRRKLAREIERIQDALKKVQTDRKTLEKLATQAMASDFLPRLRKLEGADFDSPFNFAWRIDYADILGPRASDSTATLDGEFGIVNETTKQQKFVSKMEGRGGFDLILGNPPFVTARNPVKRELYRERWKRVCSGNYLLLCPFFDLSFNLLRPGGQLGFIVSNAFARREIGKALVQDFFPTVNLQKIIDCSGLLFPGHGTPTTLIFGSNAKPDPKTPIRVATILPGGGDLRTPPENSPLWCVLSQKHDCANKQGMRLFGV
jgi:hypothetical protein